MAGARRGVRRADRCGQGRGRPRPSVPAGGRRVGGASAARRDRRRAARGQARRVRAAAGRLRGGDGGSAARARRVVRARGDVPDRAAPGRGRARRAAGARAAARRGRAAPGRRAGASSKRASSSSTRPSWRTRTRRRSWPRSSARSAGSAPLYAPASDGCPPLPPTDRLRAKSCRVCRAVVPSSCQSRGYARNLCRVCCGSVPGSRRYLHSDRRPHATSRPEGRARQVSGPRAPRRRRERAPARARRRCRRGRPRPRARARRTRRSRGPPPAATRPSRPRRAAHATPASVS